MDIRKAFDYYGGQVSTKQGALKSTSLALMRGGVNTLEQLRELCLGDPQIIKNLRDIGPRRMALISDILQFYELHGTKS